MYIVRQKTSRYHQEKAKCLEEFLTVVRKCDCESQDNFETNCQYGELLVVQIARKVTLSFINPI